MSQFEQWEYVNLLAGAPKFWVKGGLFGRDAGSYRFGLHVFKGKEPVAMSGTIQGIAKLPPNDSGVELYEFTGEIGQNGSDVYIDLPKECLYYTGNLAVAIRNVVDETKTVLAAFQGYVDDTTDGTPGVPPQTLPDNIDDFIAELEGIKTTVETAAAKVDDFDDEVDELRGAIELSDQEIAKKANRSSVTADRTISGIGSVTVEDALDEPAKVVIGLEPKQDLHGYDKPWVGGAGKNLISMSGMDMDKTLYGVTLSTNGSELTIKGTATAEVQTKATLASQYTQMPMGPFPAGTYTINATGFEWQNANDRLLINARYSDNSNVENAYSKKIGGSDSSAITFTATQEFKFGLFMALQSGSTFDCVVKVQFESGSAATDYEPYSNICPIEGYDAVEVISTGKNLFPSEGVWQNGSINTSGNNFASDYGIRTINYLKIAPNTAYTFSALGRSDDCAVFCFDKNYSLLNRFQLWAVNSTNRNSASFTTPVGTVYYRVRLTGSDYRPDRTMGFQLELGSSATDYEPFGQSITVNLKSVNNDNTVYGGTVTLNEDGSGTLVVDKAEHICDGTEVVDESSTNGYMMICSAHNAFMAVYDIQNIPGSYPIPVVSHYNAVAYKISTELNVGDSVTFFGTYQKSIGFKTLFDETTEFKAYLAAQYQAGTPVTFVLPLATPITYSLTATQVKTLLGHTQVITDTDEALTMTYKTDKYAPKSEAYAAFPESTAGPADMLTVTDGADNIPLKTLSVAVEPKQDLHGYDKPWVGGAGKNLLYCQFDGGTVNGVTFVKKYDGTYLLSGTATANIGSLKFVDSTGEFLIPNTSYILSGGNASSKLNIAFDNASISYTDTGNGVQFTTPNSWTNVWVYPIILKDVNTNGMILKPMIRLATELDATYEPYSNICPISGWDEATVTRTGKNLVSGRGHYIAVSSGVLEPNDQRDSVYAKVHKNESYVISGNTDSTGAVLAFYFNEPVAYSVSYDGSRTLSDQKTFTAPIDGWVVVRCGKTDTTVQIELGSTATAYEPYTAKSLPVSMKSISGSTVYGGTVTVNEDGTGTLVVDKHTVNLGNLTWTYTSPRFSTVLSGDIEPYATANDTSFIADAICSNYAITNRAHVIDVDHSFSIHNATSTYLTVHDSAYTTVADFTAAMAGVQVCYELKTPQIYPLTATQLRTLIGHNTLWCDAGQVSMTYRQDIGLAIEGSTGDLEGRVGALETNVSGHFPETGRFISGNGTASADYATSEGDSTVASNRYAHAEGYKTTASGVTAHSEGTSTEASSSAAHAEGNGSKATGSNSHAEGLLSQAQSLASHAEGYLTVAGGNYAHSEGEQTNASGASAHAEGLLSIANHKSQHVFGEYNVADTSEQPATSRGNYVEIVGNGTRANARSNARTLDWSGNEELAGDLTIKKGASGEKKISDIVNDVASLKTHFPSTGRFVSGGGTASANYATAEGNNTTSSGLCSHAEGTGSQATNENAHAEGNGSIASGKNAHAEGGWNTGMTSNPGKRYSTASGTSSHAEGSGCHAEGTGTHAEGVATTSIGEGAHAEGRVTTAKGTASHAEGLQTIAYYNYQHVSGQFNATENAAEIVGNGVDDANRSNIRVLDWNGNEKIAGSLTLGMGTADEVTVTAAQLKALLAMLT